MGNKIGEIIQKYSKQIIVLLLIALKWMAAKSDHWENKYDQCVQSRQDAAAAQKRADSLMIDRLMNEALKNSSDRIIQPKIDSIKNLKS